MLNSSESLSEKFIKKGFWLYFFTFIIAPIGYIVKVMISRDLSVEEVGILYGIISFLMLLSVYNDLWCTESLNYTLPKLIVKNDYPRAKYIFFIAAKVQIVSSFVIIGLIMLLIPWLEKYYFHAQVGEILRVGILFFLGINIFHLATILFSVAQDTKYHKWSELSRLVVTLTGTMILFFTDNWNTYNYMIVWVIGVFAWAIFSASFSYLRYYRPFFSGVQKERDLTERKNFLKYSLWTLVTANIATVLSQIDMQLIIVFLDQKSVWYYSNYLSLIGLPFIIISPIVGFLLPVISELSGRGEKQKIQILTKEFSTIFTIISIWVSVFFFQFGEGVSVLFFSEKFRTSWEILQYSAPFIFFNFLNQIAFQLLSWTGNVRKRIEMLSITLAINIPLTLICIHSPLWVHWAALAVGISWVPLWYMSRQATREYQSPIMTPTFWRNIAWALMASLLCYVSYKMYNINILFGFFIAISVYMSIFLLINKGTLLGFLKTVKRVRSV